MANIATITNNVISALSGTTSQVLLGDATLTDFKLDSLTDVNVPTPGDGNVLKWNATTSLWEASGDAGVTGSGVAGQVTYWGSASTIMGSNNLFWDDASVRLGVGRTPSARRFEIQQATGSVAASIGLYSGGGSLRSIIGIESVSTDDLQIASATGLRFYSGSTLGNIVTNPTNERFRVTSGGNFIINNASTDNGLRFQVTGDGYFSGSLGIGSSTLTESSLRLGKNITGAVVSYGILNAGIIQSDVTSEAYYNRTFSRTAAASFTLGAIYHYVADQALIGAGSTVTNQYGFVAQSGLIGATNNYGFYGNIASGTGRWNLYMNGTAANYLNGTLSVGGATTTNVKAEINYGTNSLINGASPNATTSLTLSASDPGTTANGFGTLLQFRPIQNRGGVAAIGAINTSAGKDSGVALVFYRNSGNGQIEEAARIDGGGTLGIRVVPNAAFASYIGSGGSALQMIGGVLLSDTSSFSVGQNIAFNGASYSYINSAAATTYQQVSGTHRWSYAASGTAGNTFTFTEAMRLDASGNLGLGVTPSAWNTILPLQIRNSAFASFTDGSGPYTYVGANWFYSSGDKYITTAAATLYSQNAGRHIWFNAPSGTAGNAITFTQAMTLTSGGLLQVGTTTGAERLNVNGAIGLQSSGTQTWHIYPNASSGLEFVRSGIAERMVITSGGNVLIGTTTDAGYRLDVNGTMRVSGVGSFASTTSTGRIEFGTSAFKGIMNYDAVTTGLWSFNNQTAGASTVDYFQFQADGAAILTLKKSGAATFSSSVTATNLALNDTSANGSGRIALSSGGTRFGYIGTSLWALGEAGTDMTIVSVGGLRFATNDSSPTKLMLTTGGNLLIGTTTDSGFKLDVNGTMRVSGASTFNANTTLTGAGLMNHQIVSTGIAGYSYLILKNSGASGREYQLVLGGSSTGALSGKFHIYDAIAATARFVVDTSGNIGIGTDSPTTKLDVNGTMRVSGASTFGGNMTMSYNQNGQSILNLSNTTAGANSMVYLLLTSDASGGTGQVAKYSSTTTPYKIITSSSTYLYNAYAGDIAILNDYSAGAIKMAAGNSSTAHFTIASTGAATFSSSVTAGSDVNLPDGNSLRIGTQQVAYRTGNEIRYGSGTASDYLVYYAGATEKMRLFTDGNLLIGTSATNAGFKLDVTGTMRVSGASTFLDGITTNGNVFQPLILRRATNTVTAAVEMPFQFLNSSSAYATYAHIRSYIVSNTAGAESGGLRFATSNNGSAPTALEITNTGAATFSNSVTSGGGVKTTGGNGFNDTDGTRTVGLYSNFTASTAGVGTTSNHDFAFYTNTAERMRITSGGNVGIAMTPSYKLDVTGEARVSNAIAIGTTPDVLFPLKVGSLMTVSNAGAATFSADATINGVRIGKGPNSLSGNTVLGATPLNAVTTGNNNVAIGTNALRSTTTGSYNIAIGTSAGGIGAAENTTGSLNIFIGAECQGEAATQSNRTWIGGPTTTSTWLAGNLLLGTKTNSTYRLDVVGTTRLSSTLLVGGVTTLTNLAGADTRIVVADASGNLSTQPTSTYLSSLSGEATNSGNEVTLTNSAVIGKLLTGLNVTSAAITASDSILSAFGKIQGQIDGLQGGTIYKGSWNASTNTPTITSGTGTQGHYYVVTTAGTTTIDGVSSWAVGDWIIFNGTVWEKIPNVDAITSVNGQTGVVNLTTSNIDEGTNLYYTDARSRAAISLTVSGASGSATYNNSTGVLNIPTYTLAGLGGAAAATTITINGVAQDLSANRTFDVGTVTSIVAGSYLTGGTITTSGTIAVDATTTNTGNKIVARDASGNFAAGTITAALTGNASTATTWQTARTITIGNTGKSVDGSGNVSWSLAEIGAQAALTNPVTGTGAAGQVAFWNGATTQTGSNSLFWDSTNARLGIGTASPSYNLHVVGTGYFSDNVRFPINKGLLFEQTSGTVFGNIYMNSFDNRLIINNNNTYSISIGESDSYVQSNFGIGQGGNVFGSGTKVFSVNNGTVPSSSVANSFLMYSADIVTDNAAPHFRTENGAVIKLYQETTSAGNALFLQGGGNSVLDDSTFDGYTLRQVVRALRNQGILA